MDALSIVQYNFDAFQAHEFEASLSKVDESWTYDPSPYSGPPGIFYRGHDGWHSLLAANGWRDSEVKLDVEWSQVDRYVLAAGSVAITAADGARRSHPTASLHLVLDGRIQMSRGFVDEREALEAVGFTADQEFRFAFDAAPDAMVLLDDAGRIVHGNRAAAGLVGLPRRELQGVRIDRFAPPEFLERAHDSWERFKREGRASGMGALLAADGSRQILEFRAVTNYVAGRHLVVGRRRDREGYRGGDRGVLTPRQREVLSLLALGLNGPETADRLFLSAATVRTHVQNAMHALGARTRAQAVAEALIQGELESHPPGAPPGEGPDRS
ncbi:MAG: LuxR C-terminal-related transcriptional regulator [Solirubrobacterales bacterium]